MCERRIQAVIFVTPQRQQHGQGGSQYSWTRIIQRSASRHRAGTPFTPWTFTLSSRMLPKSVLVVSLCALSYNPYLVQAAGGPMLTSAEALATQYSLTTSTSIPFPTATLASSGAQQFIETQSNDWSLSKGHIQNLPNDTAFVQDPFPNSPTPGLAPINNSGPVLQVTYPEGSLHTDGGTQLYSLWNTTDGSVFNSMMLSYELAFDEGFPWVKGGKLPGLRGGPNPDGCSGGNEPNGTDCFSTRLMWRTNGEGEGKRSVPSAHFSADHFLSLCLYPYSKWALQR